MAARARAQGRDVVSDRPRACAFLADHRLEAVRKVRYPGIDSGAAKGVPEGVLRRGRVSHEEVGLDRRVEDVRVLAGEGEGRTDVFLPILTDVPAGDRHPTRLGVEEAQEQVGDRGLSRPAGADESHRAPGSRRRSTPSSTGWACRRARSPGAARSARRGGCGTGETRSRITASASVSSSTRLPAASVVSSSRAALLSGKDRVEGGESQQCERRDEDPVERSGVVLGDRDRQHPGDREACHQHRERLGQTFRERVRRPSRASFASVLRTRCATSSSRPYATSSGAPRSSSTSSEASSPRADSCRRRLRARPTPPRARARLPRRGRRRARPPQPARKWRRP